ncbi:hypothetical protein CVT24_006341 [Panaeolus cyanescens]|uniref:Uncharacterized protein n=1 Tax=Panaeolus cyanescens TaxID=181874 RepID=A0A409YE89_9AGAR|nr:hypothetical protein CVT24_006341 [Panaeolus cyanescens]
MLWNAHWAVQTDLKNAEQKRYHEEAKATINTVFGASPDYKIIHQWTTSLLAKATIKIAQDNIPNNDADTKDTMAVTDPQDHRIYIFELYHRDKVRGQSMTDVARARILLHELMHSVSYAYDWWTMDADGNVNFVVAEKVNKHLAARAKAKQQRNVPLTEDEKRDVITTPLINGYWHSTYQALKEAASHKMHMNADTWAVFGYYSLYRKLPTPAGADPSCFVWSRPESFKSNVEALSRSPY